jgi:hypothetical protein
LLEEEQEWWVASVRCQRALCLFTEPETASQDRPVIGR